MSASPREGRRGLGKGRLGREDWGGVPWFPGGAASVVVMGLGEEGWHGASCIEGVARGARSLTVSCVPANVPKCAQNVRACKRMHTDCNDTCHVTNGIIDGAVT